GFLELENRLGKAFERLQRMSEVVMRLGKIRADRQGLLVAFDSVLAASRSGQGRCEQLLRLSRIAIELDRPTEERHRLPEFATLQLDQTQTTERAKMVAVGLEHEVVEPLRLPQSALIVQLSGLLKGLFRVDAGRSPERRPWQIHDHLCPSSL